MFLSVILLFLPIISPLASSSHTEQSSTLTSFNIMANATEAHNHEQVHSNIPLDTESYSIAPSELSLEQVHVYVRHGTFRYVLER